MTTTTTHRAPRKQLSPAQIASAHSAARKLQDIHKDAGGAPSELAFQQLMAALQDDDNGQTDDSGNGDGT